jgi:hypothetical protein
VECYDVQLNEWKIVAPMSTRRSSVGVGVVGGEYMVHFKTAVKNPIDFFNII